MGQRDRPYRDSLQRNHWPDTQVRTYQDYTIDWAGCLSPGTQIVHVQWFLPTAIRGNRINMQGTMTVIWLQPTQVGTYAVHCKVTDDTGRVQYKTVFLSVVGH